MSTLHNFLFNVYPYICLTVFLMGSLARFDRDQYTWKSDSSQILRAKQLRWGSNLFHAGILFLFVGHTVGLLTPHFIYEPFITPAQKQLLAIYAGGIAGFICFIGLSLLLHRRMFDPRIRLTSHRTDLFILLILWVQLVIGLVTLPFSLSHSDGSVMLSLSDWAQRILTFRPDASGIVNLDWPYKVHLVLGMTIFLLFPFSRLVHVWSGFATVAYVFRPPQLVRSRRLGLKKTSLSQSQSSTHSTTRST
ncbi:respiratory nitrate reductase subunit gamma [Zwartia panacis]|uniref:respiratory nitrate reductase subunit gamma n=1 Tax=Zwartia panacis TaxID=2683345 RepID=UPI0025B445FE|nr:respiratory nitrate reductase subunit gamma [Zwartia panacis]MDN4015669.1 respiratory nitrate reductase subunit gamma [Zwartia panacis]